MTAEHHVGVSDVLAYVAAGVVGLWGVAHALPTARVVHGFSDTSRDNRLVITQEWLRSLRCGYSWLHSRRP
jgi:citrate synthase